MIQMNTSILHETGTLLLGVDNVQFLDASFQPAQGAAGAPPRGACRARHTHSCALYDTLLPSIAGAATHVAQSICAGAGRVDPCFGTPLAFTGSRMMMTGINQNTSVAHDFDMEDDCDDGGMICKHLQQCMPHDTHACLLAPVCLRSAPCDFGQGNAEYRDAALCTLL